jgi:hypothetical protein
MEGNYIEHTPLATWHATLLCSDQCNVNRTLFCETSRATINFLTKERVSDNESFTFLSTYIDKAEKEQKLGIVEPY